MTTIIILTPSKSAWRCVVFNGKIQSCGTENSGLHWALGATDFPKTVRIFVVPKYEQKKKREEKRSGCVSLVLFVFKLQAVSVWSVYAWKASTLRVWTIYVENSFVFVSYDFQGMYDRFFAAIYYLPVNFIVFGIIFHRIRQKVNAHHRQMKRDVTCKCAEKKKKKKQPKLFDLIKRQSGVIYEFDQSLSLEWHQQGKCNQTKRRWRKIRWRCFEFVWWLERMWFLTAILRFVLLPGDHIFLSS